MTTQFLNRYNSFWVLYLLLIPVIASSQNLIKNPSFENYSQCPDQDALFEGYVEDWFTFFSTPNYLNYCDFYPAALEEIEPRTGDAVVLCKWMSFLLDYEREYLHTRFKSPLVAGEDYYLEFYVHNFPSIAIKQVQAHFSVLPIDSIPANGILPLEPHVENQGDIITSTDWVKIAGCYTANGGEEYLVIGNFASDENTDTIHQVDIADIAFLVTDDVSLYQLPDLLPSDTTIYEGETLTITSSVSLEFYLQDSLIDLSNFAFEQPGVYTIATYLEECGHLGDFEVTVLACDSMAIFTRSDSDSIICIGEEVVLFNTSNELIQYYLQGVLQINPIHTFEDSGVYTLIGIFQPCDLQDTLFLEVINCEEPVQPEPPIEPSSIYIPNAFSPNGDLVNDVFTMYGDDYELNSLKVFHRWGGQICDITGDPWYWDGTYNGEQVQTGVYVYTLLAIHRITGEKVRRSGEVHLFR